MRLDKFLQVSRLVKRRTVANELCDHGRVKIGGRSVKAGTTVKEGDELQLKFGAKTMVVKVVRVPQKAVPVQEAPTLYEVVSEITEKPSL
ncbi:MAG: RNA-binding S4 domain-containing protein [Vampirovibrio sp.]|nr:RNA-binding S4 domain-containing protein [Vampirovibrio sp.]